MAARYFTPDEANAALAQVRPLVEAMVEHAVSLGVARAHQQELDSHISGNGGDIAPTDLAEAQEAIEREADALSDAIEELQALGVQIKDIETGLVDFPAREDVLLCWHVGEGEIRFWHGPEDGFAGRKPLPYE
jgi:hypothetical protein